MSSLLTTFKTLVARARETMSRGRIARELDEELEFHLDAEVAHNIAQGMSPNDARRAAVAAVAGPPGAAVVRLAVAGYDRDPGDRRRRVRRRARVRARSRDRRRASEHARHASR